MHRMTLLKYLHSEWGVWLRCNARKPANPPAWLLSEQQADVSICQKYAALCKNIEEVKNELSGQVSWNAFQLLQLRGRRDSIVTKM